MRSSLVLLIPLLLGGCATTPFEPPGRFDDSALRERAWTATGDGVRVSAVIPGLEESEDIFGVDLATKRIQAVWIEIENLGDRRVRFLPTGMDPEYFSPLEVAFGYRKQFASESRSALDEHFERLSFRDPVPPGQTVSGFVFTNEDEGAKVVNVDLIARRWSESVTLVLPVPGNRAEQERLARVAEAAASQGEISVESEADLRAVLEALPCCTTSPTGEQAAPLNVVMIGRLETLATPMQRRGYRVADLVAAHAFGREHDLAGTKRARWVAAQPHELRVWLTGIRYRGAPVWVGQIVTPRGGRFAPAEAGDAEQLFEPDVDEARLDLVQDMMYSQSLATLGFVKGVGLVRASQPRVTTTGSTYYTDGLRAVFMFEDREIALSEIGFFEWERLIDHHRKQP